MSILPVLTASKVLKALRRGDYVIVRKIGSHAQLKHLKDPEISVTVAVHNRDISRKNMSSILKQAKLSPKEFLKLLK